MNRKKKIILLSQQTFNKKNIDNNIDIIRKKFHELNSYKYVYSSHKLKFGLNIKYVNLNLDTVKSGIYVKKIYQNHTKIFKLGLKNSYNFWAIKPSKYHIFYKKPVYISQLRKTIDEYLKNFDYDED